MVTFTVASLITWLLFKLVRMIIRRTHIDIDGFRPAGIDSRKRREGMRLLPRFRQ